MENKLGMKNSLPRITINWVLVPTVVLVLLSGRYKPFFIFFLLSFIYELRHVLIVNYLKFKIFKIENLTFGF